MDDHRSRGPAESTCTRLGELAAQASPDEGHAPDARGWVGIEAKLGPSRMRPLRRWLPVFAVVAVVALASGWLLARRPLSFRTQGCTVAGDGSFTAQDVGLLVFEEGTRVELQTHAVLRVNPLPYARGAEISVDDGEVAFDVVHRPAARWTIVAGPFRVLVTGTRFGVRWSRASGHLRVAMSSGTTLVSGGSIHAPTPLRTGQALEADAYHFVIGPASPEAGRAATASAPAIAQEARENATMPPQESARPSPSEHGPVRTKSPTSPRPRRSSRSGEPGPVEPVPTSTAGTSTVPALPTIVAPAAVPMLAQADEAIPRHTGPWHVHIGADGRLGNGLTGTSWLAGGAGASFATPIAHDEFLPLRPEDGQLCTHGRLAAWSCVNEGTPRIRCNWDRNWGVAIGFFVREDKRAWGEGAASSIALDFHGRSAVYRLNVHRHGDASDKLFCVEDYKSGQLVRASSFKSRCWDDAGESIADFTNVDWFNLQFSAGMDYVAFHYCLTDITIYP
jgi:hypothetical protein